jgi:putative SOS response-associated peptidase YedK
MCGRFELHANPAAIALAFGLAHAPDLRPRYNIAPTQMIPVVRQNAAGERELVQVRWGLVPRWARDPSIGVRMINARAETVADKPAFRNALQRHRCLVPADGFYEWRVGPGGKQPMRIARADGQPFGMAGLYERWRSPEGEVLDTCTILTTHANALLSAVHERMPVIVPPAEYERWLEPANTDVTDLFARCADIELRVHPVSTRVNAVRNDDATLIDEVVAPAQTAERAPVTAAVDADDEPATPELPLQERLF